MARPATTTRATLLAKLRDCADAEAWAQFEAIYRGMLVRYCRTRGVQQADADDLVQAVFAKLVTGLRSFEYDPAKGRFRSYLYRCVQRALGDWYAKEHRASVVAIDALREPVAPGDVAPPEWEREWVDHHYRMALDEVTRSIDPRTIEVFEALLSGRSVREIAESMGVTDQAVYKVQQRMRQRLKEQIAIQVREEDGADR